MGQPSIFGTQCMQQGPLQQAWQQAGQQQQQRRRPAPAHAASWRRAAGAGCRRGAAPAAAAPWPPWPLHLGTWELSRRCHSPLGRSASRCRRLPRWPRPPPPPPRASRARGRRLRLARHPRCCCCSPAAPPLLLPSLPPPPQRAAAPAASARRRRRQSPVPRLAAAAAAAAGAAGPRGAAGPLRRCWTHGRMAGPRHTAAPGLGRPAGPAAAVARPGRGAGRAPWPAITPKVWVWAGRGACPKLFDCILAPHAPRHVPIGPPICAISRL